MMRCQKRHVALLEVLIAFTIIALCIIPLIYPHVALVQSERKFLDRVELDHMVNLLFADQLQKLYEKKIPWSDIEGGKEIPFDQTQLQKMGTERFPYEGTYRFELIKKKPPKPEDRAAYLFNLFYSFKPKVGNTEVEPITYQYTVTIERRRAKNEQGQ